MYSALFDVVVGADTNVLNGLALLERVKRRTCRALVDPNIADKWPAVPLLPTRAGLTLVDRLKAKIVPCAAGAKKVVRHFPGNHRSSRH